jgi:cytochrome P450
VVQSRYKDRIGSGPSFQPAKRRETYPTAGADGSRGENRLHYSLTCRLKYQYSGRENPSLESDIDGRVQELLTLIRTKYLSTPNNAKPVDLARKIQYFTLDVISLVGFGKSFGDLSADDDLDGYIAAGEEGLTIVSVSAALGLSDLLQWPPIARSLGPSEKDARGFGRMKATARSLIDARLKHSTDQRSDMLASFRRHGLSPKELFNEAVLQILAGSDTTATALRCLVLYLIGHPTVYKKLQAEIDEAVASGIVPASPDIISNAALLKLPYIQAVVREGLRIHPPVTDVVPKKVPAGGDTVVVEGKSIFLPGGTDISYSVWSLNRRKDIFGQDSEQFRPERWILDEDADKDKLAEMRRTKVTFEVKPYSGCLCVGSRSCLPVLTRNAVLPEL